MENFLSFDLGLSEQEKTVHKHEFSLFFKHGDSIYFNYFAFPKLFIKGPGSPTVLITTRLFQVS